MDSYIGNKYNKLTVLEELPTRVTPKGAKLRYFKCLCDCGKEHEALVYNLTSGKVKSCGCHRREVSSQQKGNLYEGNHLVLPEGRVLLSSSDVLQAMKFTWYYDKSTGSIQSKTYRERYLKVLVRPDLKGKSKVSFVNGNPWDYRKENIQLRTTITKDRKEKKAEARKNKELIRRKSKLSELRKAASDKGGRCLSSEYLGAKAKHLFECSKGHQWKTSASRMIHGKDWCPSCSAFKTEETIRDIIFDLTGIKLLKSRPRFLKAPKHIATNVLELDGYNEEHKLAFEYHGIQHYRFHTFFHRNDRSLFEQQKLRDQWKRDACENNGVHLIEVPTLGTYVKEENLRSFIEDKLPNLPQLTGVSFTES
jgi:hypothetical protein